MTNTPSKQLYTGSEHVCTPDIDKVYLVTLFGQMDTNPWTNSNIGLSIFLHYYIHDQHSTQAVATLNCVANMYAPPILTTYYMISYYFSSY